jgi:hypothetical protein
MNSSGVNASNRNGGESVATNSVKDLVEGGALYQEALIAFRRSYANMRTRAGREADAQHPDELTLAARVRRIPHFSPLAAELLEGGGRYEEALNEFRDAVARLRAKQD